MDAKTAEDILSCETEINKLYNQISEKLLDSGSVGLSITNYEDIQMLYDAKEKMSAYYGNFYVEAGFPYSWQVSYSFY